MPKRPRPYQAIVVSHTHWDREWYQTFEQYRIRLVRLVDIVLALLETDPRFHCFTLDGQTVVLEDYLAIRPENEARLRKLVRDGRLLIGPWYVLPDEFLVSGEALVRNLMLGRKVGAAFGPFMDVGYVPDPFGHVAQLPQILAGFGIDSFIFSRGLGDEGELLGSDFLWQAPDGTAVLAVHQIGWGERSTGYLNASSLGYASPWVARTGPPDPVLAVAQLAELSAKLRRYARTPYLLLNNGCDHLDPQPEVPDFLAAANAAASDVSYVQGTFPQYIAGVRAAGVKLETWQGELRRSRYAPLLAGVFSTRMYLKQENDRTQRLLERWTEPFSAIAALEGAGYPGAFIWQAWRYLLWNQPHDSICGCSIDQVHVEMMLRFGQAQQIGDYWAEASLAQLATAVDTTASPDGALPFILFNPLGQARHDVAVVTLALPVDWPSQSQCSVQTFEGEVLPCQLIDRRECVPLQDSGAAPIEQVTLAFPVRALPSLGYRAFALTPLQTTGATSGHATLPPNRAEDTSALNHLPAIANSFYQVVARPDGLFDITHKPTGRVLSGVFALVDEADAGDEYTFAPLAGDTPVVVNNPACTARVVDAGPVVASLQVTYDSRLPAGLMPDQHARSSTRLACPISIRVSLHEGVDRINVEMEVDNAAGDHRLRLLLPTGIVAGTVAAAGHFGVVERPVSVPIVDGWAEDAAPTNHHSGFVSIDDGRHGVALIAQGTPEYEAMPSAQGTTLALTLLRCVGWLSRDDIAGRPGHAGPGLPVPGAQCVGHYSYRCAVYMFGGSWQHSAPWRRAAEHSLPPRVVVPSTLATTGKTKLPLPAELSFLAVEGEGLVLSAMKRSEDDRWLVVRVHNVTAAAVSGRLRFYRPIREAALLRLDEQEVARLAPDDDGTLAFEASEHKIVTMGVQLESARP